MLPILANDGRIVVTASSVHDPESPGGAQGVPATLGNNLNGLQQLGKDCEMIGECVVTTKVSRLAYVDHYSHHATWLNNIAP